MAPEQSKGKGKYSFEADIYSLGIIFFEMWCDFGTLIERDKALTLLKSKNKIDSRYDKLIPPNAAKIILWLVKEQPYERPSTITLLQR